MDEKTKGNEELQRLRDALALTALQAELRSKLDPDYAAMMAERHRARVVLRADGLPDPVNISFLAAEIVNSADPKWRLQTGGGNVYDEIRRTMREAEERETREQQHRAESMKRLSESGGH